MNSKTKQWLYYHTVIILISISINIMFASSTERLTQTTNTLTTITELYTLYQY